MVPNNHNKDKFSAGLLDGVFSLQLSTLADPLIALRPSLVACTYNLMVPAFDLIIQDFCTWMQKTKLAKCKKYVLHLCPLSDL